MFTIGGHPFSLPSKINRHSVFTDRRFRKSERLHLKDDIDALFKEGRMTKSYPMLSKFRLVDDEENLVRILVSVPKKRVKKASERNRIKRHIKETYRLLKPSFSGNEVAGNKGLHVALILTGLPDVQASEIRTSVGKIFNNIFDELKSSAK